MATSADWLSHLWEAVSWPPGTLLNIPQCTGQAPLSTGSSERTTAEPMKCSVRGPGTGDPGCAPQSCAASVHTCPPGKERRWLPPQKRGDFREQGCGRTSPPLFHEIIVITGLLLLLCYKWRGEQLVEGGARSRAPQTTQLGKCHTMGEQVPFQPRKVALKGHQGNGGAISGPELGSKRKPGPEAGGQVLLHRGPGFPC